MKNPFRRTYSKQELQMFDFLSKNKLFLRLTKKEMSYFLPYLHLRNYQENEVVFFRNDPSQALYILKSGEVTLSLDIEERFEVITNIIPNASVGNNVLLRHSRRIYNAIVSSSSCELYVLPQVNIHNIFERKPIIKAKMLESLAEVFNNNSAHLLQAYQSTYGFFNLSEMFHDLRYGS